MKIIFLGPPGSGKGTYASRLQEKFGWLQISTGDLVRAAIKEGTEAGKQAESYYNEGKLVPNDIVIKLFRERISQDDCKDGFILDGFPRTLDQTKALEEITDIDVVINLVIPKEIIVKKLAGRRVCKNCGYTYNVADIREGKIVMPPLLPEKEGICDKCGGELYQRDDDKPEVIAHRFDVYHEQTAPLIDYYKQKGILKDFEVNASPKEMVPKIIELLGI